MPTMKLLACVVAALLIAAPAVADEAPSLLGTWSGEAEGVGAQDGWKKGPVSFVIGEQRGRAFTGKATYPAGGGEETSEVYGTIAMDNRTVLIADDDGAYAGTVAGDTLSLCYVESGPDASTKCLEATRQK
jgi:hypothetical protein